MSSEKLLISVSGLFSLYALYTFQDAFFPKPDTRIFFIPGIKLRWVCVGYRVSSFALFHTFKTWKSRRRHIPWARLSSAYSLLFSLSVPRTISGRSAFELFAMYQTSVLRSYQKHRTSFPVCFWSVSHCPHQESGLRTGTDRFLFGVRSAFVRLQWRNPEIPKR